MTTSPTEIKALLDVAVHAAVSAGTVVRARLDGERTVTSKGHRDIVTDADWAAQNAVVGTIREVFPDHGFLTEEPDSTLPTRGRIVWIIDPLDGTVNYSRQLSAFCVSVAAAVIAEDESIVPVAAAVYDPVRTELFSAGRGLGARLGMGELGVSQTTTVEAAIIALDFGHSNAVRSASLGQTRRLAERAMTIRAFGSAVLALAWVAAGRLDAYINNAMKPWDLAAGWLLVEESGGRTSVLDGRVPRRDGDDYPCLASNHALHEALQDVLRDESGL